MADKKKEDKPLVDKYTLMKTDDLMKVIENYHANTPEAAQKREANLKLLETAHFEYQQIENDYLVSKRGASKNSSKVPKILALDKKKVMIEASELLNKMLLESVRRDLGDKVAEEYAKNPHYLVGFARGKGLDFYAIRKNLIDNYKNLQEAKEYQKAKGRLASDSVNDLNEINRAKGQLIMDDRHHKQLRQKASDIFKKEHQTTLDEVVEIPDVVEHYENSLGGKVNADYLLSNDQHFSDYKDKKKKA